MTTTNIIISTSMQKQKTTSTNNNQQGLEETFTSTKDDVEISLAILNTWSSFHQVDRPSSSNWLCLHRHRHHHCLYHHHHRLYSYTIILTVTNLLTRIDLTILRYGTTQTQAKPSMVLDRDMEASTLLGPAYLSVSKDRGGGHIVPPLNIFRLGEVMVPILFGNVLLWNDLPYSKLHEFGCL